MVEAAWTYRLPARVGRILLDRLEGLPVEIRDIAWKAHPPPAVGGSHRIPNIGKTGERVVASSRLENGHESVQF
jgi:hypothetical protein